MTQIRSVQVGETASADERHLKREPEGSDGADFEGLLAASLNSQANESSGEKSSIETTGKLGSSQSASQRRLRSSNEQPLDTQSPPVVSGGSALPQFFATATEATGAKSHTPVDDSPALALYSRASGVSKSTESSPSQNALDDSLRQHDLSRMIVKVTDQQTHFAPVVGPKSFAGNWAANSMGQSGSISPERPTLSSLSRADLDDGRGQPAASRIKASDGRGLLAKSMTPDEAKGSADPSEAAIPLRSHRYSATDVAHDAMASVKARESVSQDVAQAKLNNQDLVGLPKAASQVLTVLLEEAPSTGQTATPFVSQPTPIAMRSQIGSFPLRTITIQLQPESMGLVQVRLMTTDGVLSIRLEVERSDTLASLDGSSTELAGRISNGGLQLGELVISPLKVDRHSELNSNSASLVAGGGHAGAGNDSRQGQAGRSEIPQEMEFGAKPKESADPISTSNNGAESTAIFGPGRRSWLV